MDWYEMTTRKGRVGKQGANARRKDRSQVRQSSFRFLPPGQMTGQNGEKRQ
jgi:hypothetical protein